MSDEILQALAEVRKELQSLRNENQLLRSQGDAEVLSRLQKIEAEYKEKDALVNKLQVAYQEKSALADKVSRDAMIELQFEALLTKSGIMDEAARRSVKRNMVDELLSLEGGVVKYGEQSLESALSAFLTTPFGRRHRVGRTGSGPAVKGGRGRVGLGLSKRKDDGKVTGVKRLRKARGEG